MADNGFSLLELIIVLAITAALAGIAVLSQRAMRPGLNLSIAARQLSMALKAARTRAIADHGTYRLMLANGAAYQAQRKDGAVYVDDGRPIALPDGIAIIGCTATDHAIGFRARGTAESFGTVTIVNGRGEARQVVVDITGQVRVQ